MHTKTVKKSFTIIELLVALSLFVAVVIPLFSIFFTVTKSEKALLQARAITDELFLFQVRMQTLFFHFKEDDHAHKKKIKLFTVQHRVPILYCVYNNRAEDFDADFRHHVVAALTLEEGKLVLLHWPFPEKKTEMPKKMRKEVLLQGVESVSYTFLGTPFGNAKELNWQRLPVWEKEYTELPTIVSIRVVFEKNREESFWFIISQQVQEVVY